tara:strand:+ start:210 stop:476 length:267 start_codon:yes stop_codon:yes gene_type:complete
MTEQLRGEAAEAVSNVSDSQAKDILLEIVGNTEDRHLLCDVAARSKEVRATEKRELRERLRARAWHPSHNPNGDMSINWSTLNYQEGT